MNEDQFNDALKDGARRLIERLHPGEEPPLVSEAYILCEVIDENMQKRIMSLTTMGDRPWLLMGLLNTELIAVTNVIAGMQELYGHDDESSEEDY